MTPKRGPHLVAELPLDVIEIERQILVGAHIGAEDLGDHLLVGRPVEHVALVPVADAQHLLAVVVVAAGFAPEIGRLDRRHQHFDRAGAVLLLAHDGADLVQDAQAQRQPGVDAGRLLADHAGAQHQPMRDDLRLLRRFLEDRQEIAGETHRLPWDSIRGAVRAPLLARAAELDKFPPVARPSRLIKGTVSTEDLDKPASA